MSNVDREINIYSQSIVKVIKQKKAIK